MFKIISFRYIHHLKRIQYLLPILIVISISKIFVVEAFQSRPQRSIQHKELIPSSLIQLNMCQLLGMNCAQPTDCLFSFAGFSRRGGETDKHSDGWGIAFYEGKGVRLFLDPLPAAKSPIAKFLSQYPIKTLNMMSHIRYATKGDVLLENVHPFQREMWGIQWAMAHNGDVPLFSNIDKKQIPWIGAEPDPGIRIYNPVGDTDSEAAFCAILNALKEKFDSLPTLNLLYGEINTLCREISKSSDDCIFNMLLICGEHLQFAYSWPGARPGSSCWNGLHYIVREPPFSRAQLIDCDYTVDFAEVTCPDDRVAVITTAPLTKDEDWIEFKRGELILFDDGKPLYKAKDLESAEDLGHGLQSDVLPPSSFIGSGI